MGPPQGEVNQGKIQETGSCYSARRTFFNDVGALLHYLLFESWEHLLDFMIEQLKVVVPYDTS